LFFFLVFKVTPGWKFNHWEIKGVPIRLEIGPRDLAKEQALAVIRYTGEKRPVELANLSETLKDLLEKIQQDMYERFVKKSSFYQKKVFIFHLEMKKFEMSI